MLVDISEVRDTIHGREYMTANLSIKIIESESIIRITPLDESKAHHAMELTFSKEPEKTKTSYIYRAVDAKGLIFKITIFNPLSNKVYLDFEIPPENGGIYAQKFDHQATFDDTW